MGQSRNEPAPGNGPQRNDLPESAPEPELRAGSRVVLTGAPDGYPERFNIVAGMAGTVDIIDGLGTVHVRWDAGQRFGIIASARHLLAIETEADPAS